MIGEYIFYFFLFIDESARSLTLEKIYFISLTLVLVEILEEELLRLLVVGVALGRVEGRREHAGPGLAFERMQWRARKGRNEGAIELMRAANPEELGEPARWGSWRRTPLTPDSSEMIFLARCD